MSRYELRWALSYSISLLCFSTSFSRTSAASASAPAVSCSDSSRWTSTARFFANSSCSSLSSRARVLCSLSTSTL